MNEIPKDLPGALGFINTLCAQFQSELAGVPITGAHAEAIGLISQLDQLVPELLEKHRQMESSFAKARQEIQDKVATARQTVARGKEVQEGRVPPHEIEQMQSEHFHAIAPKVDVAKVPTGWNSQLSNELFNRVESQRAPQTAPVGANAWNDWRVDSTI
jgi:enoyl-CoA hydratase/carnithine racemase